MAYWQSAMIDAYRLGTMPFRQLNMRRMKRAGNVPIAVLFYHRVGDDQLNQWTISESEFRQQIDWFQRNFDLVTLAECQRRIASGFNDRPTLSITFDDGYSDNCFLAVPMLLELGIPVTYFVTTYHTSTGQPFPHDAQLTVPVPTNSIESLRAMAAAGVEIGAHTRSHSDLGPISDRHQLFDEVVAATQEMAAAIGREIRYFAFPFGQRANLNRLVFRLAREHGFRGVCSAYGGLNEIGCDAFHLQRLHGDPNFARIKNWLTYDPRLRRVRRFEYKPE